jgi:uncharacterized protein YkwD
MLAGAFAGALCALAVASCAESQPARAAPKPQPAVLATQVEKAIHDLINRERRAENIARGNLYATVNGVQHFDWSSEERIARTTVAGWMASPGHRANILTAHWQREGIGVVIAPDRKVYITQNFC